MLSNKEQQVYDTLISQLINSKEFSGLPPQAKVVVQELIRTSGTTYASNLVKSVEGESNFQLESIPGNLVGNKNPVDIVTNNLNTVGLNSTLSPILQNNVTPNLTDQLTSELINQLKISLPPGTSSFIDYNVLADALTNKIGSVTELNVQNTLNNYSTDLFSGGSPIAPIVPNADSYFNNDPQAALENVNKQYDSSYTNKALASSSSFDTQSQENTEKLITQTTGFIDPTATFPTEEYKARVDTNKLATGDVNGTIVQKKEDERTTGIQLPNSESFEQPKSPYKGEYPFNKVIETESGHIVEIDDTPGAERLHIFHKSGTFIEIDAYGNFVRKTKGSDYQIIDKNGYISVVGDASVSVKGSVKVFVGGNADIEVEGDTNIKCLNDITMQAAGRVDISATEEINFRSANINLEADVNLSLKGDVNAFLHSTDIYTKANNNINVNAINNYNLVANNNSYIHTLNNHYQYTEGEIYLEGLGKYNLKTSDDIYLDSDNEVHFNSNKASRSEKAEGSKYANYANIGLIGKRTDVVYEKIEDAFPPNFLDNKALFAEDSELEEDVAESNRVLKNSGVASEEDLNTTQVEIESSSPQSISPNIVRPNDFLLSQTYVPDNFKLSPNFTLGMLSSKAAVSNYKVVSQGGLGYGQIVYNLQAIALNVLEPMLALYPNMFVTSGFRTLASSSRTSDHVKGKAVDIQFKNTPKSEYYEIARKLATQLNYDKILLEYKTFGTGLPWIHISFDVSNPRKLQFTYLNNRKYSSNLTRLA